MSVLYTNNATTTLSASITNSTTSLSVASGTGSLFPAITGSDFFFVTISNSAGTNEIVKVTARSVDTFTIVRAQDGTSAAAWSAGDKVELRITKAMLDQFKVDAIAAYTASDVLAKLLTVDGAGSGLDSDTLDGNHASAFYLATNPSGYTTNTGTVTSVGGTGSYGGLTLSGTVTTSGNLTLGGTPTGTWPISVSGASASCTGNASTATTLQTARTINGVSFNGSANITITAAADGGNADTLDGQHGSYYQPASTAITTSNIGSQSVNYATSSGSAGNGGVTSVNGMTGAVTVSASPPTDYGAIGTYVVAADNSFRSSYVSSSVVVAPNATLAGSVLCRISNANYPTMIQQVGSTTYTLLGLTGTWRVLTYYTSRGSFSGSPPYYNDPFLCVRIA